MSRSRSLLTPPDVSRLITAASNGNISEVSFLLSNGVDVNGKDRLGYTALHKACLNSHHLVVTLLIERGADINSKTLVRITPLHSASSGGLDSIVSFLLDRGADINARCNMGGTALHNAAFCGRTSVVSLLIERGANVNSKSCEGTPLDMAIEENQIDCIRLLEQNGGYSSPSLSESEPETRRFRHDGVDFDEDFDEDLYVREPLTTDPLENSFSSEEEG